MSSNMKHQCIECEYSEYDTVFWERIGLPMQYDKCKAFSIHPVNTNRRDDFMYYDTYCKELNWRQNCPIFKQYVPWWKSILNRFKK